MQNNSLLTVVLFPIAAGILCLFAPARMKAAVKAFAVVSSLAVFGFALSIFLKKPLFYEANSVRIFLADNLSAFIILVSAFFGFLILLYSVGYTENNTGRCFGYMLITLGSAIGSVLANDMTVLLVFWGILAAMLYLLTNLTGSNSSSMAAKKSIIIIGSTDALMIFGLCLVWSVSKTTSISAVHIDLSSAIAYVAYFSIAAAALAKAGAWPLHSWLPEVAEFAPTNVGAYLPASLDKLLGIYLLYRVTLDMFAANHAVNFLLALIGSVTIIFAVVIALIQHDLKRLLGYHAVSQVGYMVLGIGTGSAIGIAGGLFHMLNNAIYKSCLFLTAGSVEKKAGSTDMDLLGGLFRFMPATFAACLIAALSISGIPPLNGFVSKWMIYQGIIETASAKNPFWVLWLVAAMFGSALTIASFMKLIYSAFLGRPGAAIKAIKESPFSMVLPMAALALLCIIFGIFAFSLPIGHFIAPAVKGTIKYAGTWNAIAATSLIICALLAGSLIYILLKKAKFRTVDVFIGGEDVSKLERVTGTDFYNTIKEAPGLKSFYKRAEFGSLDIYNVLKRVIYYFTRRLQQLHNGIMPTYMVWCLLGAVCIFFIIFAGY